MADIVERLREPWSISKPLDVTAERKEAADEIERLRAASKWQPISTAPKDGTEFIAYRDDAGPFLLRWSCASEMMTESEIEQSMMTEEQVHEPDWFFADFATGGRLNDGFTHWMPLPSPPTQVKEVVFHGAECDASCDDPHCHYMHKDSWEVDGKQCSSIVEAYEIAGASPPTREGVE